MTIYFCGGWYKKDTDKDAEFGMVSPSGKDSLPYVVVDDTGMAKKLFHVCKHHSHLYAWRKGDSPYAVCVQYSWEPRGVGGETVNLTDEQQIRLAEAAKKPWRC